jgi:hypothetical protein
MSKKLAVGSRKAAMAGKASATKRELIDTGQLAAVAKRQVPARKAGRKTNRGPR